MRIAHFHGSQRKEDGVTRVVLRLIDEGLACQDASVIVTGWAQDKSISPVPIHKVRSVRFPLYPAYRIPLPRNQRYFQEALDIFEPDVAHAHSPDPLAWDALRYAREKKIPIVATHHTDFVRYLKYYHISQLEPLARYLLRNLYSRVDAVTTPSSVAADDLRSNGVRNVYVIPWGTELRDFSHSFHSEEWRSKVLKNGERFIILYAGRLTWEKDLRTFASTCQLLRRDRNDFVVVVAGEGPARKRLQKEMPEAVFLGHIEKELLSICYASSDIFLFPSSTETFGNVTLEAMASGTVPVVADEGGSTVLVEGGKTGFRCRPRDAKDFANKTCLLLDDAALLEEMRLNVIDYSRSFSWDRVYHRLRELYESLGAGPAVRKAIGVGKS